MSSKYSLNAYSVRGAACAALLCAIITGGATEKCPAEMDGRGGVTGARTVEVPGSNVILKLWDETSRDRGSVPHYSISLDGETFSLPTGGQFGPPG